MKEYYNCNWNSWLLYVLNVIFLKSFETGCVNGTGITLHAVPQIVARRPSSPVDTTTIKDAGVPHFVGDVSPQEGAVSACFHERLRSKHLTGRRSLCSRPDSRARTLHSGPARWSPARWQRSWHCRGAVSWPARSLEVISSDVLAAEEEFILTRERGRCL